MKRLLSFVLSVVMLLPLIPPQAAAEAAVSAQKYIFSYESYGLNADVPINTNHAQDMAATGEEAYVEGTLSLARFDTDMKWANVSSAPWRVDGMRYISDMKLKSGGLWWTFSRSRLENVYGAAILIDVANAGEYTPVLEYQALENGYVSDIYLVPVDEDKVKAYESTPEKAYKDTFGFYKSTTSTSLQGVNRLHQYITAIAADSEYKEKYLLGTLDMQETAPDESKEYKVFSNRTLEKKKYYLIFHIKNQTTVNTAKPELLISSFQLAAPGTVDIPKLSSVVLSADRASIPVSRTAKTSVSLAYADGQTFTDKATVTYTCVPENIVEIDTATGVITALSEGEVTVSATVTSEDATVKSNEIVLTVTEKPSVASLRFSQSELVFLADDAENSSVRTEISAVMTDGITESAEALSVSYKSSDEKVAAVDENGTVTALSEGSAVITATVMNGDEPTEATGTLYVTVYSELPSFMIDFSQTVTNDEKTLPSVTPGYKFLTDEGISSSISKGTAGDTGTGFLLINTWMTNGKEWPLNKTLSGTFAFSFECPAEGYYNAEMLAGALPKGGTFAIYTENDFLGNHSFWSGNTDSDGSLATGGTVKLNTVHLKRGENKMYMYLHARNSLGSNPYLAVGTLKFIPVKGEVTLSRVAAELPAELAVGETFRSDAVVYMTDGSTRHFSDWANDGKPETKRIIRHSSDNSCIELSGLDYIKEQTAKRGYLLTAKEAGEATVKISASLDGESFVEKSQKIKITNDEITKTSVTLEAEELFAGDSAYLTVHPVIGAERVSYSEAIESRLSSSDESVVTVEGNLLTAHKVGKATITVTSTFNGKTVSDDSLVIEVLPEGMTDVDATAGGSRHIRLTDIPGDTVPLYAQAISNLGKKLDMTGAGVWAEALTPERAYLTDSLDIVPVSEGEAKFRIKIEHNGRIREKDITLTVARAKTGSTYRTEDKKKNVRKNVKQYDWAKETAEKVIAEADPLVGSLDLIYDMIHSEGIPRSSQVGRPSDPNAWICRYCNVDLRAKYGLYSMQNNALSRPWKTQCPDCKRLFPSNNFEGFYKLGLNEYGEFDRLRALQAHRELFGDKSVTEPGKEHSKQWKAYYGYGVKGGYLYNELYEDLAEVKTINAGKGLRSGETQETWGVDDGMGYIPSHDDGTPYYAYIDPKDSSKNEAEAHTYIAEYLHWGVWRNGVVYDAIVQCADAYYYTGDKKYGRVAAILIDRLADFYPEYNVGKYGSLITTAAAGNTNYGKTIGRVWETNLIDEIIVAYDTVFELYEDEDVLNYIKEKGEKLKFRYAKNTPSQLRTHTEDGILRAAYDGLMDFSINGNFGMDQKIMALIAVILDSMPESAEILNFMLNSVWLNAGEAEKQTGGGINAKLVDDVDADGQGDEASHYNAYWISRLYPVNECLEMYDRFKAAKLSENPKFIKMLYSNIPLMSSYYTPNIGDSLDTLEKGHWASPESILYGWKMTADPIFAQVLYTLNGNSAEGLHYAIDAENPEKLSDEVEQVIREHGKFNPFSVMLTSFGFAALRDGDDFTDGTGSTAKNTRRDVWMYYGSSSGHGHKDTMNLGMTAFGLNFLPDFGYPEQTGTQPNRLQWVEATLAHNTVTVNEKDQTSEADIRGKAKHFERGESVQLMDVSTPYVYNGVTEEYRRSVVQIKVDDENSYAVDFFRVLGGNTHTYSLHASSDEVVETTGLDFTLIEDENGNYISGSQLDKNGNYKGTYAGRDAKYVKKTNADGTYSVRIPAEGEKLADDEELLSVVYGQDPNSPAEWTYTTLYPRGYTWLRNVDRDTSPENRVEVDFAIKDYNKAVADNKNLHLRLTVLNAGNVKNGAKSEIAIADGLPPQTVGNKNVEKLKYLLVKNSGKNLDTVFTTVLEPYRALRYIKRADELEMRISGGEEKAGDAHRAVRIEHISGRVDYILYSTNSSVTYEITLDDGSALAFSGFIGVYTVQNGENTYRFLCDGTVLGEKISASSEISGTVKAFTKTLEFENEIIITPETKVSDAEIAALAGEYVYIDNGEKGRSGSYEIFSASRSTEDPGDIVINTGMVTLIRKYADPYRQEKGYLYTIAEGQKARIPRSFTDDSSPVFSDISNGISVSAGSAVAVVLNASSEVSDNITYVGTVLPRGAGIDEKSGRFTWKPDSSQVGENHVAITARDDCGRESTLHFYVTVYGSTTSKPSDKTETPSAGTTDTSPAGGGEGGGGGDAPTDKPDDTANTVETDKTETDGENAPDASGKTDSVRFTDLGSHAWAEAAITSLAEDGIIKGTSENTFSPASNITRADFALLLVRAFKLESDSSENFADVTASDYFASELAIARNTGIVGGIGDNKFAPRNHITRQDMMVIVYRAMQELGVGFGVYDEPKLTDLDEVADYAKEAVNVLVSAGLVNGKSGRIAPTVYTTRAEVAVLLKRIMEYTVK
ncbi:MAG: S-layer homology domain-containing protein [Oscillospiraceae bacterium]|nr:S-layer homology domain-containing protein [Oscillospiraceae bacterium]